MAGEVIRIDFNQPALKWEKDSQSGEHLPLFTDAPTWGTVLANSLLVHDTKRPPVKLVAWISRLLDDGDKKGILELDRDDFKVLTSIMEDNQPPLQFANGWIKGNLLEIMDKAKSEADRPVDKKD